MVLSSEKCGTPKNMREMDHLLHSPVATGKDLLDEFKGALLKCLPT